jgi:hypothetical protein
MITLTKTLIVAALVTVSVAALCSQRRQMTCARAEIAQTQTAARENEQRIQARGRRLEQTRQQLAALEARQRARLKRHAAPAAASPAGDTASDAVSARQGAFTQGFPNEHWSDEAPYVEIAKCNLTNMWVIPFGQPSNKKGLLAEFAVAEEAAVLLSLTATEQAAIETALTNLAARCRQIEATRLRETETPPSWDPKAWTARYPGAKVYTVGAFAEEAEPLKTEFEQVLSEAIGPDRAELFQQFGRFSFGEKLGDFGRKERSIAFMPPETRDGQRWFQQIILCSPGGAFRQMRVSANDPISRLPPEWRHLFVQAPGTDQSR